MSCLTLCTGWMLRSGWHGWSKARELMQSDFVVALTQHDFVLARIRLTRMAAERGPILSGACGQGNRFQPLVAKAPSVGEPPQ
jgi:hypothetical protein